MDFSSPTPRRVGKPNWLDLRLVLGIVLVLAAILIGAKVVATARHTDKQLAVTRTLAVGTTLRASDLDLIDAQLPAGARSAHVYLTEVEQAVGKVLSRPLAKGELVPSAALVSVAGRTTVSVPLAADAAPRLARGQRIVIWLSSKSCPSLVLVSGVTVQDVHATDAGTFASGGTGQDVVLSLVPELAERIVQALAIADSSIRAGVLTGTGSAAGPALSSLDACGASPSASP